MATLPSFAQAFSSIPAPKHKAAPDDPAPAPPPPSKRRRVTISGAPHALVTDVPPAPDHASSTPISPVVMGLTLTPDNPLAIEKVKSMISVKQKQVALIQQRRGSAAPPMSPTVPPPDNKQARPARPSPRTGNDRPPSPPPPSLPPPPISFARRRAEQLGDARKKPADILISPRDAPLQPAIQSAPPVAHGRFPTMALPRLPAALAGPDTRRVASAVPPTPTALARHRPAPRRSPAAASVPIAATRVPPTPALAQTDKAAFLAPFELFYDALNDSRQLKAWLADQLQRSNAVVHALTQQQDSLSDLVDALVEKQLAPMRHQVAALHRRVEELEDALRAPKHKHSRPSLRNGLSSSPRPTESYTFPPAPALEPSLSSRRRTDRDVADTDADPAEPAPPRRIEASRSLPLEPPQLPPPPRLSPRIPFETSSPKPKAPASTEKRRNSVISEG
ncbi:hypothetical protein C0993_009249 [Termitomyces sp. T159_Od127]|nr:hypothetical protein C0993_009249 [Termitomyces sp. T159_Od127]